MIFSSLLLDRPFLITYSNALILRRVEMAKMDEILNVLKKIHINGIEKDLVSSGILRNLSVEKEKVFFLLKIPKSVAEKASTIKNQAMDALSKIEGVKEVNIDVEIDSEPSPQTDAQSMIMRRKLENVKSVIAIASGKGGVGKSTVAANLAIAFKKMGMKVALLDGDVYGPSIPKMFGIENERPIVEGEKIIPIKRYGLEILSIGLLIEEDTPIIWRGPMLHKALDQFLFDVSWGEKDIMIIDLPPGTGDAQISIAQLVELKGGVVVTTPQDISLIDVKKAIRMFEKTGTEVFGVIENMSNFICPHCGKESKIFGEGGGKKLETEMGVRFLGQVPIDPVVVTSGDNGLPVVLYDENSRSSQAFLSIAKNLLSIIERV